MHTLIIPLGRIVPPIEPKKVDDDVEQTAARLQDEVNDKAGEDARDGDPWVLGKYIAELCVFESLWMHYISRADLGV